MPRIELVEYRTSVGNELSPAQLLDLTSLAPSVSVAPSSTVQGTWDLTPGAEVGVIVLGDTTLDIRPKVGIDRLLFLVAYVLDPVRWPDHLAQFDVEQNPLEAIVPGFIAHLRRALGPGVLHGYRPLDDTLTVVRGRIRFGDQIRLHHGTAPPIEVSYDEFSDDIDENRLLRAALHRLRRIPMVSARLRRELHHFDQLLAGVTLVDFHPNRLPELTWTRLNHRYRSAVDLASLILRNTSIEHRDGGVTSSAFLVNMNRLFEDFVVMALRQQLGVTARTLVQGAVGRRLDLDHAGAVHLEPDLSWWDGQRCTFVGDCKYKRLSVKGFKHPDLYQMLAYTTATRLQSGLLIYAAGEAEPWVHTVPMAGKELHVAAIDLSGTPHDVLAEVTRIAAMIETMRTSTARTERSRALRSRGLPEPGALGPASARPESSAGVGRA